MTNRADDRRRSPREPAVPNKAVLEWWAGAQDRRCPASLVDVSREGACVAVDPAPPVGHPVWLRLEHPAATPWVQAKVLRHDGSGKAAMQFDDACPDDFLLAATLGITFDFGMPA